MPLSLRHGCALYAEFAAVGKLSCGSHEGILSASNQPTNQPTSHAYQLTTPAN